MRALVVYCHPREGSYCSALRDATAHGLRRAGHDVTVLDLAAIGFDPVMGRDEWLNYTSFPDHSGAAAVPPDLVDHVEAVTSAEVIAFVYPTWWSGLPAQLKGWLERVLMPGVGFVLDDARKVRPGLGHVRRIVTVSTYGSPWSYVKFVNDNGRRTLTRALRLSCSWRTRVTRLGLYAMDKADDDRRAAFLARVEDRMART